jgi:hypothetical protein
VCRKQISGNIAHLFNHIYYRPTCLYIVVFRFLRREVAEGRLLRNRVCLLEFQRRLSCGWKWRVNAQLVADHTFITGVTKTRWLRLRES